MILAPTYVRQEVTTSWYAGTVLLDVAAAERIIAKATFTKLAELYRDPTRSSAFIDNVRPWMNFAQWWRGYSAEAAYAMHYGLHVDGMLDDRPGKPDFVRANRFVDVKATRTGSASYISIREDVLERDLAKWRFAGARVTDESHLVTLIGHVDGLELSRFGVHAAADGHDKRYIRVPFDAFTPIDPQGEHA